MYLVLIVYKYKLSVEKGTIFQCITLYIYTYIYVLSELVITSFIQFVYKLENILVFDNIFIRVVFDRINSTAMDLPVVPYFRDEYVETNSGNRICRVHSTKDSTICGTQNIVLNGKNIIQKDVIIRGDLAAIRSGKYCIIRENTIIRPSYKKFSKGVTLFPVHIGDHVMIEEDCVISAAQICSFVHIGAGAIVGGSAVLKECCRVLPGSVVAADSVFPPYSTIGGNPARVIGREPECTEDLMIEATKQYYDNFLPSNIPKASFA